MTLCRIIAVLEVSVALLHHLTVMLGDSALQRFAWNLLKRRASSSNCGLHCCGRHREDMFLRRRWPP